MYNGLLYIFMIQRVKLVHNTMRDDEWIMVCVCVLLSENSSNNPTELKDVKKVHANSAHKLHDKQFSVLFCCTSHHITYTYFECTNKVNSAVSCLSTWVMGCWYDDDVQSYFG